jgi:hypothetical protein
VTGLTHRQSEILTFGRVMVEDLARRFEVSAQTIRTSSAPSKDVAIAQPVRELSPACSVVGPD